MSSWTRGAQANEISHFSTTRTLSDFPLLMSFAIKSRSGSEAFSSGSGIKCQNILQRNRGICI